MYSQVRRPIAVVTFAGVKGIFTETRRCLNMLNTLHTKVKVFKVNSGMFIILCTFYTSFMCKVSEKVSYTLLQYS